MGPVVVVGPTAIAKATATAARLQRLVTLSLAGALCPPQWGGRLPPCNPAMPVQGWRPAPLHCHPSPTCPCLAALCAWGLFSSSSAGRLGAWSAGGALDAGAGGGANGHARCPLPYLRLSLEDIRAGQRPYLLGGVQQPNCTNCHRTDGWGQSCQFKRGPVCPAWVQERIVQAWLARGHELALTFTPCDLWQHIQGRTLFILGDSMALDFFKARRAAPAHGWRGRARGRAADPLCSLAAGCRPCTASFSSSGPRWRTATRPRTPSSRRSCRRSYLRAAPAS